MTDLYCRGTDSGAPVPWVKVAVPAPVHTLFDYAWGKAQAPVIGGRVSVPFGRRHLVGIIVTTADYTDVPASKVRAVGRVYDTEPLIPESLMKLLTWASHYYHHPIGEVLTSALPVLLRQGQASALKRVERFYWQSRPDAPPLRRTAVVQQRIVHLLNTVNTVDKVITPVEKAQRFANLDTVQRTATGIISNDWLTGDVFLVTDVETRVVFNAGVSAADIGLDEDRLLVPVMFQNRVDVYQME